MDQSEQHFYHCAPSTFLMAFSILSLGRLAAFALLRTDASRGLSAGSALPAAKRCKVYCWLIYDRYACKLFTKLLASNRGRYFQRYLWKQFALFRILGTFCVLDFTPFVVSLYISDLTLLFATSCHASYIRRIASGSKRLTAPLLLVVVACTLLAAARQVEHVECEEKQQQGGVPALRRQKVTGGQKKVVWSDKN